MTITVLDYSTSSVTMITDVDAECFPQNEDVEEWLEHHGFHLSQISYMTSEETPEVGETTQWDLEDALGERRCSHCHKIMTEGYCIEGGQEYYCSDECLHEHMTDEEYLELYDCGSGDTYWTQWGEQGATKNSDVFPPNAEGRKVLGIE